MKLEKFIGMGATRICFEHPLDANKCAKIVFERKNLKGLEKEVLIAKKLKPVLKDFIVDYQDELIDTDLGKAMVCELLRDDDGGCSVDMLSYCSKNHKLSQEIVDQMKDFMNCLLENNIFFFDFNIKNFVIQIKNGNAMLKFIDLKSFNHYKPLTFLRLEKIYYPLSRLLMKKRYNKLLVVLLKFDIISSNMLD